MSVKQYLYQVIDHQAVSSVVTQIFLRPQAAEFMSYQAGQYVKVIHETEVSPLSIASAPRDLSTLELHLSHTPQNQRAQHLLQQIKQDKQLAFRGPYGSCTTTRLLRDAPIIFLARGTGFAPVKAIIEELKQDPSACPPLHLYWSAGSKEDLYCEALIRSWEKELSHFHFTPVLGRSFERENIHRQILLDYPDLSHHQLYVSGPEEMTHAALGFFTQHGLSRERFYSDIFDYDHLA